MDEDFLTSVHLFSIYRALGMPLRQPFDQGIPQTLIPQ